MKSCSSSLSGQIGRKVWSISQLSFWLSEATASYQMQLSAMSSGLEACQAAIHSHGITDIICEYDIIVDGQAWVGNSNFNAKLKVVQHISTAQHLPAWGSALDHSTNQFFTPNFYSCLTDRGCKS